MFTFAFFNQKVPNICHTKIILFKSYVSNSSVSSVDSFFFLYKRRYLFQMYIVVLNNSSRIVVSVL